MIHGSTYAERRLKLQHWLDRMSIAGVDRDRLKRVLAFIKEHPEQHEQDVWFAAVEAGKYTPVTPVLIDEFDEAVTVLEPSCGTAACFAGWTLFLDGNYKVLDVSSLGDDELLAVDTDEHVVAVDEDTHRGALVRVNEAAQDLLGLTPSWSYLLFFGENELEDIELIVEVLCGERPWTDADRTPGWSTYGMGLHYFTRRAVDGINLSKSLDDQDPELVKALIGVPDA